MSKKARTVFNRAEILTSLVYLCAISTALMYVLCYDYRLICSVIMTIVCFGIFAMFWKLRNRKLLSLLAFIGLFIFVDIALTAITSVSSAVSFIQFIYTSSDFFEPLLAAGAILLFSAIIGFTASYFTVYTPRPGFLLLPAFIPLILAAETTGGLPAGYIIFMGMGFFIACFGIARPEKPSENVYIDDGNARVERLAAIGILTAIAVLMLIMVPRVETTRYGYYLESLFTRGRGRNFFGGANLTEFDPISRPNSGNNTPGTNTLFIATTSFPANVAASSYDLYDGKEGWKWLEDPAIQTGYPGWEDSQRAINSNLLIYKLKQGASDGKLSEYKNEIDSLVPGTNASAAMIITVVDGSDTSVVLHPQRTYNAAINDFTDNTYRNRKDEIFTEKPFGRNATYRLTYYTERPNESFTELLENIGLERLLGAAYDEGVITAAEYNSFLYQDDYAQQYLDLVEDYGITPEIQALADEITAGLTNSYQKALAIEQWFGEAGFIYDLNFVPDELTANYFLFESRRGICTDFATASTLLLRAAGVPARYTTGYALSGDSTDSYGRYEVTAAQAHAYTTAYIDGYGWVEVDGTKYAEVINTEEQIRNIVIILVIISAVLTAFIIIFRRQLSELLFKISLRFKDKSGRIRAVYLRTRKLACSIAECDPKTTTAEEVRDIISRSLYIDEEVSAITDTVNELVYSKDGIGADVDDTQLYQYYKTIYERKKSMKK